MLPLHLSPYVCVYLFPSNYVSIYPFTYKVIDMELYNIANHVPVVNSIPIPTY